MRTFFSTHWKSIVLLVILILLAIFTMAPGGATPDLAARLRAHVQAIAAGEHNAINPAELERAAQHIESALTAQGYVPRRQQYKAGGQRVRNIEVSVANLAPHARPTRIFIVGARYEPAPGTAGAIDNCSGPAVVLELARLLKGMQPARGTEVKFVFFVNEGPPWFMGERARGVRRASVRAGAEPDGAGPGTGNFIAFVGTRAASEVVRQALAAFRGGSGMLAEGLAAPSYVEGVTLFDHAAYNRYGYPALMIADTAFLRYPYYHTADDSEEKLDYEGLARVVDGLARTIGALAGAARM
jgi:hypothetical protein